MEAEPPIYQVPRDSYSHLAKLLLPHLAQTLVLLRHLQWSHSPSNASIFTTFPLHRTDGTPITALPSTFCAARIDRASFRGVGLYIFSSLELDPSTTGPLLTAEEKRQTTVQLLSMLAHLHHLDNPFHDFTFPTSLHQPNGQGKVTDRILAGHLHSATAVLLEEHGLISPSAKPYNKYVIAYTPTGALPPLPDGMEYTTITETDYELVMANNSLIQDPKTFADCPTAAIRLVNDLTGPPSSTAEGDSATISSAQSLSNADSQSGDLIAWAFLTGYGSIRSLHVQPAYRGQGLARKVVLKLLEDEWPAEFVSAGEGGKPVQDSRGDERIVHTDIDPTNEPSIRTFAPIGREVARSQRYWVPVDLAGAEGALGKLLEPGG